MGNGKLGNRYTQQQVNGKEGENASEFGISYPGRSNPSFWKRLSFSTWDFSCSFLAVYDVIWQHHSISPLRWRLSLLSCNKSCRFLHALHCRQGDIGTKCTTKSCSTLEHHIISNFWSRNILKTRLEAKFIREYNNNNNHLTTVCPGQPG